MADINIFEMAGILRDSRISASTCVSDANYKNEAFDLITERLCGFMSENEQRAFKIVVLYRKPADDINE